MVVQKQLLPVVAVLISVAVTTLQLSVYKAAIDAATGAGGTSAGFDKQASLNEPPGNTPVSTGASVSPPVYITIALGAALPQASTMLYV